MTMNEQQVKTIFSCLSTLNRALTAHDHTVNQEAVESVFMALMQIQVSVSKNYPPTYLYKERTGFIEMEN